MGEQVGKWVTSGMGLQRFSVHAIYDMFLTQYYSYWNTHFSKMIHFMELAMGDDIPLRHFDEVLWDKLASNQPRNRETLTVMFWSTKTTPIDESPVPNSGREPHLLPHLSDAEYLCVYENLLKPNCMTFRMQSRREWDFMTKYRIPALRSVVPQVLRWLIPDGEPDRGRSATKADFAEVLNEQYFTPKKFIAPNLAGDGLVQLVANTVFNHVLAFAPTVNPSFETYPTFQTADPKTNKQKAPISIPEYKKKFRVSWPWFHLAKTVAQYCSY